MHGAAPRNPHSFSLVRMSHLNDRQAGVVPDRRPVRVMLVDDHQPLRSLIRGLLETSGCEVVIEAGDGLEAVELMRAGCDVVVMDHSMPGMNGTDAIALIAQRYPSVEIVGFTTSNDPEAAQAMIDAGATCHFCKTDYRALVSHIIDGRRGIEA
jgi:DNA-binding NarL/FixJ family response regulator